MFNRKNKNEQQPVDNFDEVEDVDIGEVTSSSSDMFEELAGEGTAPTGEEETTQKQSIKQRYSKLSRMFHKHLIYVRIVSLSSAGLLLIGSVAGGIFSGLHTEGAKAREITTPGTALTFSKTGGTATVGQAVRYGHNLLIPVFTDQAEPIDSSLKPSAADGGYSAATDQITLPSYSSDGSSSAGFMPISAKNYRMYISTLKGEMNPGSQAKYVRFGATGIGAIMITNVNSDATLRVLVENKKVYKVPGASSPGLTVDGHVVDTKRDVILINSSLATARQSNVKFGIKSDEKTLFDMAYGNSFMTKWHADDKMLTKLSNVNKQKLAELKANKDSLTARDDAKQANNDSEDEPTAGGTGEDGQSALDAAEMTVQTDKDERDDLNKTKSEYDSYRDRVTGQMTIGSDYHLVRK